MQIITEYFKVSPQQYAKIIAGHIALRWFWLFLLPVAVFFVLSFNDIRFVLVALMFLFIVYPSIILFAFVFWGLSDEARVSIQTKRLLVSNEKLIFQYESEEQSDKPKTMQEEILQKDISSVKYSNKYIKLFIKSKYSCIVVPLNAVKDLPSFVKYLSNTKL